MGVGVRSLIVEGMDPDADADVAAVRSVVLVVLEKVLVKLLFEKLLLLLMMEGRAGAAAAIAEVAVRVGVGARAGEGARVVGVGVRVGGVMVEMMVVVVVFAPVFGVFVMMLSRAVRVAFEDVDSTEDDDGERPCAVD